jgi:hypothetical protein
MSGIKRTLDETWYEYSSRVELHWMEEEYFGTLATPNRNNMLYDKSKKQEEKSCGESEGSHIQSTHENDQNSQRPT